MMVTTTCDTISTTNDRHMAAKEDEAPPLPDHNDKIINSTNEPTLNAMSSDDDDSDDNLPLSKKRKKSSNKKRLESSLISTSSTRTSSRDSFSYVKTLERKCDDFREQIRRFKDIEQDYHTLRDKVDDYVSEIRRMHQEREQMIQTIDRIRSENLALVSDNARLRRLTSSQPMIPHPLSYPIQSHSSSLSVPVKGGAGSLTSLRPPLHPHHHNHASSSLSSSPTYHKHSPSRHYSRPSSPIPSTVATPISSAVNNNTSEVDHHSSSGSITNVTSLPTSQSPSQSSMPEPTAHSSALPPATSLSQSVTTTGVNTNASPSFAHDVQNMIRTSLHFHAQYRIPAPWIWSAIQRYPGLPQSASWSDFGYRSSWRPPFQANTATSSTTPAPSLKPSHVTIQTTTGPVGTETTSQVHASDIEKKEIEDH